MVATDEKARFEADAGFDEPLLEDSEHYALHIRSTKRFVRPWVISLVLHCVLLAANLSIFSLWKRGSSSCRHPVAEVISPMKEAIEYEPKYFDVRGLVEMKDSKYVGPPSDRLDDAWHELLQNTNIAVPAETMEQLGRLNPQESILLPDNSGYLAMPFAYHQLHCIKRIHHFMYESHYFPNITATEHYENEQHNHHCLELLRQSVMCAADVSLITMKWGHKQAMPMGDFAAAHSCRNWDAIDSWAEKHSPKRIMEPGWLKHPTLGASVTPENRRKQKLGIAHDS